MAAFAYYQSNKYDEAIIALDRFIQLHPGHKDIPYAYYLKALCYYEQISDIGRDQRITQQALDALAEVVKRFPDSPYARDARLKVELAIDHLARQGDGGRPLLPAEPAVYRGDQPLSRRHRALPDHHPRAGGAAIAWSRATCRSASRARPRRRRRCWATIFPGSDWYQDSYYLMTGEGTPAPVDEKRWFFGLF